MEESNTTEERTILHDILQHCEEQGNRAVYNWLDEKCEVRRSITYHQLAEQTRQLAVQLLQQLGLRKAERVVLCYPPGLDYILSLIACLRAGVTAVSVDPPSNESSYTADVLANITHDCSPECVLTNDLYLKQINTEIMEKIKCKSRIPWYSTSTLSTSNKYSTTSLSANEIDDLLDKSKLTDVPLLQYTSGSTSAPKGVMPTHASLKHNLHTFKELIAADHTMVAACFLTHFHVMGLICHYLFVPCCGAEGYFMSPSMFITNPALWVQAMSKFMATFCMVPNFALDLTAAVDVPPDTDLSSMWFLSNGSESVSIDTMQRFHSKFEVYGLRKCALRAFYGLSEHTVHLTASEEEELVVREGQVSNGRPHPSVTVRAVNPTTCEEVPEGTEGEIWVQSPSKALGYWGKPEVSEATFHARMVGDEKKTYLRTGDMGFIHSGEIFILGRIKNVMVVYGRNIYMNDIENRVEALFSEVRPGRTAAVEWERHLTVPACSQESQQEASIPSNGVGFFAELQDSNALTPAQCHTLAEAIASNIGLDFRVETLLVALLPQRAMPRTGSGKRQRPLCKKKLLDETLVVAYRWCPLSKAAVASPSLYQPELVPLPPTPRVHAPLQVKAPCTQPAPKYEGSARHTSPLEQPKYEENNDKGILRKESRLCIEDVPSPPRAVQSCAAVSQAICMDHLSVPGRPGKDTKPLKGQEEIILDVMRKVLGKEIKMDTNIWAYGCNSLKAIQISSHLKQRLGFGVEGHMLYAYQTPKALLEKLKRVLLQLCSPIGDHTDSAQSKPANTPTQKCSKSQLWEKSMGIVSMACRFPGCTSPEELWKLLCNKTIAVKTIKDPNTGSLLHGGFTRDMALFDYKWFGISHLEASSMDPQQSLLLLTAWECLHRAGYSSPKEVKGANIGVFVGFGGSDAHVLGMEGDSLPPFTSYSGSIVANRISYVFDLKGPSMAIDTACASSLTAVDIAVSYLHLGKCSQALVGGVNALLEPKMFRTLSNMGMLSPEGKCRVFDVAASGYVRGEGCGVVLLKRMSDATRDENRVLAVVRSVETCHNGKAATLTSPNKIAQRSMLLDSLKSAQISSSEVSYMEAHGTGTPLGDPMEIDAIQTALGQSTDKRRPRAGPLFIGAIKANIGHLEAGAGIAGLIKTVLVLERAKAPGNPNLKELNPALQLNSDLIDIPTETVNLGEYYMYTPQSTNLLCAGVNSFGSGGSNSTVFLQQYSSLPHLQQVHCAMVLGGEAEAVAPEEMMAIIQLLRSKNPSFNIAYIACIEALQKAIRSINIPTSDAYFHHPAYLMFCLLYCSTYILLEHNLTITVLMGTSLCAELVCLALSEALILSDVMRLLLVGVAPSLYSIRFIIDDEIQPTMSLLSPTLNQLCLPGKFSMASLNELIAAVRRGQIIKPVSSDTAEANVLQALARSSGIVTGISISPDSFLEQTCALTGPVIKLQSTNLMEHIRESCLELREASDTLVLMKNAGPSADAIMPKFYERYPMRRLTDNLPMDDGLKDGKWQTDHSHDPSDLDSRDSLKPKLQSADESGYLTPTISTESVKETLVNAVSVESVTTNLLELIGREFLNTTLTTEDAADTGLFALGLDSLCLIELQDHLHKMYDIDLPLTRLTELATVRMIAAEVARLSCDMVHLPAAEENPPTNKSSKSSYDEVLEYLCGAVVRLLDGSDLPSDMTSSGFYALGMDSLHLTELRNIIEEKYAISKTYAEIESMCNLEFLAEVLSQEIPVVKNLQECKSSGRKLACSLSPHLTREGYYSIPPCETLQRLSARDLTSIPSFTVGRAGYGKIEFLGNTDVSHLNLDEVVTIEPDHMAVNSSDAGKLNKPALVYYECTGAVCIGDPVGRALRSLAVPAVVVHFDPYSGAVLKVNSFY